MSSGFLRTDSIASATTHRFLASVGTANCPWDTVPGRKPDLQGIYAVNQPEGTVVVDGSYNDWNLVEDYVVDLREAGDTTKAKVGELYLQWNCRTSTLCALLLAEDTYCFNAAGDNYFKDYGLEPTKITGTGTTIALVWDGTKVVGWEGACALFVRVFFLPNSTHTVSLNRSIAP